METRANHALIGAFTLAVLAAAFGFIWWFTAASENRERAIYRVQFQGSVSGLNIGSGVLFNGLRVGDVVNLNFDPQDPSRVVARIEVFLNTPIRVDTKARLETANIAAGQSVVQLTGGARTAESLPRVTTKDGDPNNAPVLIAEPSSFQDILQGARDVLEKAQITFGDIQGLIGNSRGSVERSLVNVERFTEALAANSGDLQSFLQGTGVAARQIGTLADNLVPLVTDVQNLVRAVDVGKVDRTMTNVEAFSQSLKDGGPQVERALGDIAALAEQLRTSGGRVDGVLEGVQKMIAAIDPAKVGGVVDRTSALLEAVDPARVSRSLESFERAMANADRTIAAVDSAKVGKAVDDFVGVAAQLRASAPRLDSALAGVERVATAIDPTKVSGAVDRFAALLNSVDPAKVASSVDSIERASRGAERAIAAVDPDKINRAVDGFTGLMTSIDGPTINRAIASFDRTVSAIDGDQVRSVMANVDAFAAALGRNAQNVDQIVKDAQEISSRLTGTAGRLDGLIADAQKVIGSDQTQGAINEFQKTAQAIRELALKLDGRTAEITSGINRLSGSGVRDLQGFAADGRRTLGELERVLRNLERNPRQFLFGGSGGVQEYRGR